MEFVVGVTAFLFPGQGSQVPGMREEVQRLRPDLLDAVEAIVGEDPFARVEESTRFAQPAILCCSLARWSALDAEPSHLLGHSMGELGALAAAGALDERQALELVALRGRLMAEASRPGQGMLVVLRGEADDVATLAARHGVTVANDNAPGQIVLSGDLDRLDAASADARRQGLRTMRLPVAGAFHSPAMAPACAAWERALAGAELAPLHTPVVSCMTAAPIDDARAVLAASLTEPVRFREALLHLDAAGCTDYVDVGPGRVLEGLVKRTVPAHV
jgi:[acyl-carrier-protein] S-malonyltransferase